MTPSRALRPARLDRLGPAVAGLYFLLGALLRQATSPTLDLDQAEQILLAQHWALGYTEQPPLYTWLVAALFTLTGPSGVVLNVLKAAMLGTTALATGLAAARLGFDAARQRAAIVGLILLPQFIWESQRDVTHSVLATTLAALAIAQALDLHAGSRWRAAAGLGITLGAGLLAKHNFLLLLPLVGLILLDRPATSRVRAAHFGIAVLCMVAVAAPHELWLLLHPEASARGLAKLGRGDDGLAGALGVSALNALAFVSPLWLFALLVRGGSSRPAAAQAFDGRAWRWLAAVLIPVTLVLVLGEARGFKDRWFQPLLIWTALWFAAGADPGSRRFRGVLVVALAFALFVPVALQGRVMLAGWLGREERPNIPYQSLARAIEPRIAAEGTVAVIAERKLLAGNLRLAWPHLPVRSREVAAALPRPPPGRWLVVCEAQRCTHNDFPGWLADYAGVPAQEGFTQTVTAPAYFLPESVHTLRFAWLDVPPEASTGSSPGAPPPMQ